MTFPPLLVLIGACLVVFGSRWPVATMPFGDTFLADASQVATWAVRAGAALVVAGLLANRRWVAWCGWLITAAALIYVAQDLWMQVTALRRQALDAGDPEMMRMIQQTLEKTRLRPGAAYLAGGLILQFIALMCRPKTRGSVEHSGVSNSRA